MESRLVGQEAHGHQRTRTRRVRMIDHVIDHVIIESEWPGYYCPVDGMFHKDGVEILYNYHCITCSHLLEEKRGSPLR